MYSVYLIRNDVYLFASNRLKTLDHMEAELLKTVGQVAGIGGIALGVFLLLFRDIIRKKIFPPLPPRQSFQLLVLISVLVWSIALAGIGAWLWSNKQANGSTSNTIKQHVEKEGTGIIHTGEGNVIITKPDTR